MRSFKERIELIEIIEVDSLPGEHKRAPHWKATLGVKHYRNDMPPILHAVFYLNKNDSPDNSILPAARNWFHKLCTDLGVATEDWILTKEQEDLLKHSQPRAETAAPQ